MFRAYKIALLTMLIPRRYASSFIIRTLSTSLSTSISISTSKYSITSAMYSSHRSMSHITNHRLSSLRELLKKEQIHGLLIPSEDPHMSEYPPKRYKRREFISGFTGSAGIAVITDNEASLFTDGRYFEQAERELDMDNWKLMRVGIPSTPTLLQYLTSLPTESRIGFDPEVHTIRDIKAWTQVLEDKGIQLIALDRNLVDEVWGSDRPSESLHPIRVLPEKYTGLSAKDKISKVRESMRCEQAGALIVSALDEVCWLFNIRGNDSEFNQIVTAYAFLSADKAVLFVDRTKLTPDCERYLIKNEIRVENYDSALQKIHALCLSEYYFSRYAGNACKTEYMTSLQAKPKICFPRVWMDEKKTSYSIYRKVHKPPISEKDILLKPSSIGMMKACKTEEELHAIRAAHELDAVAVITVLCEIAHDLSLGQKISELDVDERLLAARSRSESFIEPSFATIAGVGSNGAIVHYRATKDTAKLLTENELVLIDSGGHYQGGTTDITRTIHFGKPTQHEKEMFSRVLKGHIALSSQKFPAGTPGCSLDVLARQYLWSAGKDYGHGTGHGVGASLSVHEGPQRISKVLDDTPLRSGMVVSNEPGYYEAGRFGIRIENLVEIISEGNNFMGFQPLTLVPIQLSLIDRSLMTQDEVFWINKYHADIRDRIAPLLQSKLAKDWMYLNTMPI